MKRHALGFLEGALGQTEGIGGLASAARTLYKSRIPGVDCWGPRRYEIRTIQRLVAWCAASTFLPMKSSGSQPGTLQVDVSDGAAAVREGSQLAL